MSLDELLKSAWKQSLAHKKEPRDSSDTDDDSDTQAGVSLRFENWELSMLPQELVSSISQMPAGLSKLSLKSNILSTLPPLDALTGLFYLDISYNRFEEFPLSLVGLPNLEILDMSHNNLRSLPREVSHMSGLKVFSVTDNQIQYVSPVLADLPNLVFLELQNNPLLMPGPEFAKGSLDEGSVERIREYIRDNRQTLDNMIANLPPTSPARESDETSMLSKTSRVLPQRSHSINEGALSSRAAKRMGFVPRKNSGTNSTSGQSLFQSEGTMEYGAQRTEPLVISPKRGTDYSDSGFGSNSDKSEPMSSLASSDERARAASLTTDTSKSPAISPSRIFPQDGADVVYVKGEDLDGTSPDSLGIRSRPSDLNGSPPTADPHLNESPRGNIIQTVAYSEATGAGLIPSPMIDNTSAYLRRLSTLEEEEDADVIAPQGKALVSPVRKIMFSLYEFHGVIRRCLALSQDRIILGKLEPLLASSRTNLHDLVEVIDSERITQAQVRAACAKSVYSIEDVVKALLHPDIFKTLSRGLEVTVLRSLIMQTFLSFNELQNAWNDISSIAGRQGQSMITTDLAAADELLFAQLRNATRSAQTVLSLINDALAKSAMATAEFNDENQLQKPVLGNTPPGGSGRLRSTSPTNNTILASRVKDLSTSCLAGVSSTKKLRIVLDQKKYAPIGLERKKFWDDVNVFLQSTIAILAASKAAMDDLPLLSEAGTEIAALAKLAKEIPPLLEQSSYKLVQEDVAPQRAPTGSSMAQSIVTIQNGGMGNGMFSPTTAALPTPLTATLGAAAQAVMSPGYVQTPFFQDFKAESRAPSE